MIGLPQVALVVKNPPGNAGDYRDAGSIPGLGRSPGAEYGNPLQYSCLENPMDREIWRTTVHMVAESDKTEKSLERHYIKITGYTLKCVNFMVHKLYLNNIVLKIKCSHCVLSCVNL